MTPPDYPSFTAAIVQLADALGARAPTQAGMAVWVQTLKEFPLPDLVTQFDAWAKRSSKMPMPADLWKACNDMRTERIEQTAKAEARDFKIEAERTFQRSDAVAAALRRVAIDLRDQQPPDPKEWALTLFERFIADRVNGDGSAMSQLQIQLACDALGRSLEQAKAARELRRRGVAA